MESQHAPLGSCPDCTAQIHQRHVLITYGTGDGRRRFAECPDCRAVVHPA